MKHTGMIVAAASSLAVSLHARGAQFFVADLVVSGPHALQVEAGPAHPSQLRIRGAIGPVTGDASVDVVMTLEFSFTEVAISGDRLASILHLRPSFESGVFAVTGIALSASLYDDGALVSQVDGEPFAPQPSIGAGDRRSIVFLTESFKGEGPAFSAIGDGGHGVLEAAFHWSGFDPGDALAIEFAPDGQASSLQYWNFIPAPGGAGALTAFGLLAMRRRR